MSVLTVVAALVSTAFDPAPAWATRASIDGTTLRVESGALQRQDLTISEEGSDFKVTEGPTGASMSAGTKCRRISSKEVRCSKLGLVRMRIDLDSLDDKVDVLVDIDTTIDAGSGNDQVLTMDRVDTIKAGLGNDNVIARGGNDKIDAGAGNDTVSGGADDDEINGGGGDDKLSGNDGNDLIDGGVGGLVEVTGGGSDAVDGGAGNDGLKSDPGADDYHGGDGADRMLYTARNVGVTVTLDDQANDGGGGERDNVHTDIEEVRGSDGNDQILGSPANDELEGGVGNDTIDGGSGADSLSGQAGNDTINAREGALPPFADGVSCGPGTDTATVDLQDIVGARAECETVESAPVGQGPNVQISRKRNRASRSGRVRIRLSCPTQQSHGCRGTLDLTGRRGRPLFGTETFDLAPGGRTTARFKLRGSNRRKLRRRKAVRLRATAHEQDPTGRPKTTYRIFRLRAGRK